MIKKIKMTLVSMSAVLTLLVPALATSTASATFTQNDINNQTCSGTQGDLTTGGGSFANCADKNGQTLNDYAKLIINLLSVIIGFVAVVMIIIGGFRYITSGGSSEKVSGAKNTILYGIIGLIIVALAQVIVQFVLNKTANPTSAG
jgi:uncharacterized membrane protein